MPYKNPQDRIEHGKRYRVENRASIQHKKKLYREANKEKVTAYKHEWYLRNKESEMNRVKKWIGENKEKHSFYTSQVSTKRRSLKMTIEGTLTLQEWEYMKEAFNHVCKWCGKSEQNIDHIIPLSKGGQHTYFNVQPLCRVCNATKGVKLNASYKP